jgi:hypothetical protein
VILDRGSVRYQVEANPVAETDLYRVYVCEDVAAGHRYLLQVAASIEGNGGLERAAYLLGQLSSTAELFEQENAKVNPGRKVSYDRLFPRVVDGFIAKDQGGRRINILSFTEVDDPRFLIPLSNLKKEDHLRVTLTSSAWVMGRLLKLLAFTHDEGIAVRALGGGNILLEPSQHFALVFDWSSAMVYQAEVPMKVRKDDIAGAAKAVLASIGANTETGEYPYPLGDDKPYVDFLWELASRREADAQRAHERFYELIEQLWGREFRPFKTLPL